MNNRRVTLVVVLGLLVLALVAPVLLMNRAAPSESSTQGKDLHILALSLNGDHRYDAEAAEVLTRAKRVTTDGDESYSLVDGSRCWVLRPAISDVATLEDCV